MSYFDAFQIKDFAAHDGTTYAVRDVITAISLPQYLLDDDNLYFSYRLEDGERPEVVSHKVYGSSIYHWVIMLINKRYDVWEDFPKSDYVLRMAIMNEGGNPDSIHHYEDGNGKWVDEFSPVKTPITEIDYANKMNETKRIIKVLKPEFLSEFVDVYNRLLSS